ncbi:MAG TPA: DUF4440 domain-containing protein [Longimicrobium sp.]|nr:DUF4440 domain-containing protein [Longimicrobium sp.]
MRLLLTLSLALLSACAPIGGEPAYYRTLARPAVVAADLTFFAKAEERGMGEVVRDYAWRGVYAVLPDQELVTGPVGLANVLGALEMGRPGTQWETLRVEVSADGEMAYTFGRGSYRRAEGETGFARYAAVWTRRGQEWRMAAVAFSEAGGPGSPPPPDLAASPEPVPGPGDAAEQVLRADADFAALAKSAGVQRAFMDYAAPDGVLAGGPWYGRDAIGRVWEGSRTSIDWAPIVGGAAGGLGWTIGNATIRAEGPQGTRTSYSHYLTVWRRGADGAWRYALDLGAPRPAPASP